MMATQPTSNIFDQFKINMVKQEPGSENNDYFNFKNIKVKQEPGNSSLTDHFKNTRVKQEPDSGTDRLNSSVVRQLLWNKFVVIIGDSIQRSVYKDLVSLLQRDQILREKDLRLKGEAFFLGDELVEGGTKGQLSNGINYKEVRQYTSATHLVRFYFVTRCWNQDVEAILTDLTDGPRPDLVVMNSCLWDLTRYGATPVSRYKENINRLLYWRRGRDSSLDCAVLKRHAILVFIFFIQSAAFISMHRRLMNSEKALVAEIDSSVKNKWNLGWLEEKVETSVWLTKAVKAKYGQTPVREFKDNMAVLFGRLKEVLPADCLMVWTSTLPISKAARGGFLVKDTVFKNRVLNSHLLEANCFVRNIVIQHGFDLVDLHFQFRNRVEWRVGDGVHWCANAHRHISELLFSHVARRWGVMFPPISVPPSRVRPPVFHPGEDLCPAQHFQACQQTGRVNLRLVKEEQGHHERKRPPVGHPGEDLCPAQHFQACPVKQESAHHGRDPAGYQRPAPYPLMASFPVLQNNFHNNLPHRNGNFNANYNPPQLWQNNAYLLDNSCHDHQNNGFVFQLDNSYHQRQNNGYQLDNSYHQQNGNHQQNNGYQQDNSYHQQNGNCQQNNGYQLDNSYHQGNGYHLDLDGWAAMTQGSVVNEFSRGWTGFSNDSYNPIDRQPHLRGHSRQHHY